MTEITSIQLTQKGFTDLIPSEDGRNFYWTVDKDVEMPIIVTKSGPASRKPMTIGEQFRKTVEIFTHHDAMHVERNGKILTLTWKQYAEQVEQFAKAVHKIGVRERKSINILGHNSPEWIISFVGGIYANCISSGVYPTNNAEACYYQADHSEAELIVLDTIDQLKKYLSILGRLPNVKGIVLSSDVNIPNELKNDTVYTWDQFLKLGKDVSPEIYKERLGKQRPGECATLIYTSGTTGNPKACMLTHDNMIWSSVGWTAQCQGTSFIIGPSDRVISYLPLSHIAGLLFDILNPMTRGVQVYFARPDAMQGTLVQSMIWAKPTMFLAVPRVWEKLELGLKDILSKKGSLFKSLTEWARSIGFVKVREQTNNQDPPFCYHIAHNLILSKLKAAIGLDQANMLFTGAAPIKATTVDFFAALDMPLCGAYGMSETSAWITNSGPDRFHLRSCGFAAQGCETKINNPNEKGIGEICIKGRAVMTGYLKNEKATQETIDPQGFLHTGDLGYIDEKGFMFITGRIKEIIITAGGENIGPVIIEDLFKSLCPPCSNLIVVGENQRFLAALITLKVDIDPTKGIPSHNLMQEVKTFFQQQLNINVNTTNDAISNETVKKYIQSCIDKTNEQAISRAANIRRWIIIPNDFSISGGELTPTLKLKRKFTEIKYQSLIDELFATTDAKL